MASCDCQKGVEMAARTECRLCGAVREEGGRQDDCAHPGHYVGTVSIICLGCGAVSEVVTRA